MDRLFVSIRRIVLTLNATPLYMIFNPRTTRGISKGIAMKLSALDSSASSHSPRVPQSLRAQVRRSWSTRTPLGGLLP